MRNRLFRLIVYASVIQQFLFYTMKENIPMINFLYGVPLTRQISFHAMLFGYWYFPVFFIVYYFSGYFSCIENYEIIILIKNVKRSRYFIKKLLAMIKELALLVGIQVVISMVTDAIKIRFLDVKSVFFTQNIKIILTCLVNYFIVMLIIILIENFLEIFFKDINCNVIVNIFIIASVFIYNYNNDLRHGILKLTNTSMYARVHVLELKEYIYWLLIICCTIGIMFYKWKRKNLLGGKYHD